MLLDLSSTHDDVLARMLTWGVQFESFFDIGAAAGSWGPKIRRHWPRADLYFFEAAPAWQPKLDTMCKTLGGTSELLIAAVGDVDGETNFRFDPANPYGGAIVDYADKNTIQIPKVTLDTFVRTRSPREKFALKLDVHGAERLIFAGAETFMAHCDFVVFETYNFGPATRRFGQMSVFLEEKFGLRCVDIAEPKWRPFDKALWQLDLYFVKPEGTTLAEWRL